MKSFWEKLDKPFFCLAPMYDVTDAAYRAMFVKYGKLASPKPGEGGPDVLFTEFVSADGLASAEGCPKLLRELYFTEAERPIVAQIFGSRPENIEKAAFLIKKLGFDGMDINMGCPDRAVEKQGAGAALIKNPALASEIISAAKAGAGKMPVSVKTRLGYNKIDTEKWVARLLQEKPAAMTVHLRTRKEMSEAPAHWEEMLKIVAMAKEINVPVIGNGDIRDINDGWQKAEKYGCDGIMIGRGAFGRPWLFGDQGKPLLQGLPLEKRIEILLEHSHLFWKLYGQTKTNQKLFNGHQKNFAVMRKHFKAYITGFKGAKALRDKLMQLENADEVNTVVNEYLPSVRKETVLG